MSDYEDMIRSSLAGAAAPDEAGASGDDLTPLIGRGRRRRRRRLAAVSGAAALVVVAGAAVIARSTESDDRLVSVEPSTVTAPTSEPQSSDPLGTQPSTTDPVEEPVPQTTELLPIPGDPFVVTPTDPAPSTTLAPTVTALPLEPYSDRFFTTAPAGDGSIELRNSDGVVASYPLACDEGQLCEYRAAQLHGDEIWAVVARSTVPIGPFDERTGTPPEFDDLPHPLHTAFDETLVSISIESGETTVHYADERPEDGIVGGGRGADGSVYVYRYVAPTDGEGSLRLLDLTAGSETVIRVESTLQQALGGAFLLSPDGRFLAITSYEPPVTYGQTALIVRDLIGGAVRMVTIPAVSSSPVEWAEGGRLLLVRDTWEDGRVFAFDPWTAADWDPEAATGFPADYERIAEDGCLVGDEIIVAGTWRTGYGGDSASGTVRSIGVATGDVIDDRGLDLYAQSMVCHPDGAVSLTVRPLVRESDILMPDWAGPAELVYVGLDGMVEVRASGDLAIIRR